MISNLRILGYNIKTISKAKGISAISVAELCGLSIKDMFRVFEGRLALTPTQLNSVSKLLQCDSNELLEKQKDFVSYGNCVGHFSNAENEDIILNIIDNFIDLKESLIIP